MNLRKERKEKKKKKTKFRCSFRGFIWILEISNMAHSRLDYGDCELTTYTAALAALFSRWARMSKVDSMPVRWATMNMMFLACRVFFFSPVGHILHVRPDPLPTTYWHVCDIKSRSWINGGVSDNDYIHEAQKYWGLKLSGPGGPNSLHWRPTRGRHSHIKREKEERRGGGDEE